MPLLTVPEFQSYAHPSKPPPSRNRNLANRVRIREPRREADPSLLPREPRPEGAAAACRFALAPAAAKDAAVVPVRPDVWADLLGRGQVSGLINCRIGCCLVR